MGGSEEGEGPEVKLEDQRSQYPDCMKCQVCLTFKMGLSKGGGHGRPVESCVSNHVRRTWSYLWSTGPAVWKKRGGEWGQLDPTGTLACYLYYLLQVNLKEVTLLTNSQPEPYKEGILADNLKELVQDKLAHRVNNEYWHDLVWSWDFRLQCRVGERVGKEGEGKEDPEPGQDVRRAGHGKVRWSEQVHFWEDTTSFISSWLRCSFKEPRYVGLKERHVFLDVDRVLIN